MTQWTKTGGYSQSNVWEVTLGANGASDWLSALAMRDRSLQIEGSPNGGTIVVEGTNQVDPAHNGAMPTPTALARPLKATDGGAVSAVGLYQLLDTPAFMRVRVSGGDGGTSVTFSLNAGRTQ